MCSLFVYVSINLADSVNLKHIPTIEIGSEVAVVSFHQLLDGRQQLGVIPVAPVVAGMHAASTYRLTM